MKKQMEKCIERNNLLISHDFDRSVYLIKPRCVMQDVNARNDYTYLHKYA